MLLRTCVMVRPQAVATNRPWGTRALPIATDAPPAAWLRRHKAVAAAVATACARDSNGSALRLMRGPSAVIC